jgi:hypothetical protein
MKSLVSSLFYALWGDDEASEEKLEYRILRAIAYLIVDIAFY